MESNGRLEKHQYLKDLIDHYDDLIRYDDQNGGDSPLHIFIDIIKEEKFKCMHQLRNIREVMVASYLRSKNSAFQCRVMN